MTHIDTQTILDNAILAIGAVYFLIQGFRYYTTKHAVIDTNTVHTAYFNIMWAKSRNGKLFLDM